MMSDTIDIAMQYCVQVVSDRPGLVRLRTAIGTTRILELPAGELLPRIC